MGVMQSSGAVDGLREDRPQAKARRRGDGAAGPPPERRKPASRLMGMDVLATAHDPRIAPEPCDGQAFLVFSCSFCIATRNYYESHYFRR